MIVPAVLAVMFRVETPNGKILNLVFVVAGIAMSWLIGIVASPYDQSEEHQFGKLVAAATLFLSRYFLSKLGARHGCCGPHTMRGTPAMVSRGEAAASQIIRTT